MVRSYGYHVVGLRPAWSGISDKDHALITRNKCVEPETESNTFVADGRHWLCPVTAEKRAILLGVEITFLSITVKIEVC